jgi:teichuronic acid biosynthesis glycosyltransferase TuaH
MSFGPDEPLEFIFVSMENWDDVWRRNQFVCGRIAKRFPHSKILFVGTPRDVSNQIRRGLTADLRAPATWQVPGYPNIHITRPLKLLPNTIPATRRFNEAMERRHALRVAHRLGFRRPILWLNPHYGVHMVGKMGEDRTIYDITDDWITLTQSEARTRLIIEQDLELCRIADAVIVCSQKLYDLKKDLARNLHLIPNGVDAEHYRCVLEGDGPLPEETAAWPRPIYGYTGTIHPDRVDVDLVERMARRLKQGCFALVGPDFLLDPDRDRLLATGKVFFTGAIPYARLPQFMRAFDVSITPHRVTPFTESLNPIKLWEYLAGGKPIVATDVAGFRDFPDLVRIAKSEDDFLDALAEAPHEAPHLPEARRAEARKHSWDTRVDQILEVVAECKRPPSRAF